MYAFPSGSLSITVFPKRNLDLNELGFYSRNLLGKKFQLIFHTDNVVVLLRI